MSNLTIRKQLLKSKKGKGNPTMFESIINGLIENCKQQTNSIRQSQKVRRVHEAGGGSSVTSYAPYAALVLNPLRPRPQKWHAV